MDTSMKVLVNQNGDVLFSWVKKRVDNKESGYYAGSDGYKELYKSESGKIFGFRRILDKEEPIPEHLELCTDEEIVKLEKNDRSLNSFYED